MKNIHQVEEFSGNAPTLIFSFYWQSTEHVNDYGERIPNATMLFGIDRIFFDSQGFLGYTGDKRRKARVSSEVGIKYGIIKIDTNL